MNKHKLCYYSPQLVFTFSFIFSVFLKISYIDSREIWLDESYSIYLISLPIFKMMHSIIADIHPPLYYLLLKLWASVFGHNINSLRYFSVVFSCLIPIVSFFAAKALFKGKWIPLLCFLLILFSQELFYYSVEIRDYMVALLFLSLFFYFYICILHKPKSIGAFFYFSIAGACAFYSHYFTLFVLIPVFIHFFIYLFFGELSIKGFTISVVIMTVLTVPWLPIMLQQVRQRNIITNSLESAYNDGNTLNYGYPPANEKSKAYFFKRTYHYVKNCVFGSYDPGAGNTILKWMVRALKIIFTSFFLISILKGDKIAILLSLILFIYIICTFFAVKSLFVSRYFLFLSLFMPFFICIAASYMQNIPVARYFCVFTCILLVISVLLKNYQTSNATYCSQYSPAVEFLKSNYKTGDLIIFNNLLEEVPFDAYSGYINFKANKTGFPISIYDWWKSQVFQGWSGPVITKDNMNSFVERLRSNMSIKRIWLVTQTKIPYDPGRNLLHCMSKVFSLSEKRYTGQCKGSPMDQGFEIYAFQQQY